MMSVGINIFKQTDNIAESEPRMTSDWKGFEGGQLFEVPLHDNNQQYRTISTGLVKIQPDQIGQSSIDLLTPINDPAFPPMTLPGKAWNVALNGCPLAFGVRTNQINMMNFF